MQTNSAIAALLAARKIAQIEFPITSLLRLYATSSRSLYLNHFEGLKLLVKWLGPISRSKKQAIYIPIYFCTYEINEIAKHTGNHPSQIWQELFEINTELQACLKKY